MNKGISLWDKYKEEATKNDVTIHMLRNRMKEGMTPEEAIEKGKLKRGRKGGKVTAEMIETAKSNGICEGTLRDRIYRRWPEEDATTIPPGQKRISG